jgi:hypothetical protein
MCELVYGVGVGGVYVGRGLDVGCFRSVFKRCIEVRSKDAMSKARRGMQLGRRSMADCTASQHIIVLLHIPQTP